MHELWGEGLNGTEFMLDKEFDYARMQILRAFRDVEMPDIDEMSLLFENQTQLSKFVEWAQEKYGMNHFNSVTDTMFRLDRQGQFDVRFEFLKDPSFPFRIEAMCVLDGEAPLHIHRLKTYGSPCVMHASFKLPDTAEYFKQKEAMTFHGNYDMGAQYINSYGLFCYMRPWIIGPQGYVWIKPRVNLRDRS